jgi:hypothetical protein
MSVFTRVVCPAIIVTALVLIVAALHFPEMGDDSFNYLRLVNRQWDQVVAPFSARFLHTALIRSVASNFHCSTDAAATAVVVTAFLLSVTALAALFVKLHLPGFLMIPLLFSLATMQTVRLIYMPDQLYTTLLCIFLLLLAYNQFLLAAASLIVLFCSRESTLLLGATAVLVFLRRWWSSTGAAGAPNRAVELHEPPPARDLTHTVVFLIATAIGFLVNRHVANKFANVHHINPLLYLIAKAPYNFIKNILGIRIWTNTLTHTQGDHPFVKWSLPARFHMGQITEVGISAIWLAYPAQWVLSVITTFGAALTVLVHASVNAGRCAAAPAGASWPVCLYRGLNSLIRQQPVWMQIAAVYGIVSLVIVPLLGADIPRYAYYAWPALWLLAPSLLARRYDLTWDANRTTIASLLFAHLALCWMCIVQGYVAFNNINNLVLLAIATALQVWCWRCLQRLALR